MPPLDIRGLDAPPVDAKDLTEFVDQCPDKTDIVDC